MTVVPETMTVVEISSPGGPEVLKPATRPVPQPGHGEILVKVAAAGVNRPDVLQRAGSYPPPPGASDLPGLEVAGEVVAVNDALVDTPTLANQDPYEAGWLIVLKPDDWAAVKPKLTPGADVTAPYEAKMAEDEFPGCETG